MTNVLMLGQPAGLMSRVKNDSQTAFASWLQNAMTRRGLNQSDLAAAAGIKQNTISMWLNTDRIPERSNVEKVALALLPQDSDEDIARNLVNEALQAAFGYDDHEVIDYLRGQPDPKKDKALAILKAAFAKEDAADNAGNIGKKPE